MENQDIRWKQRFSNYNKALLQLGKFIKKEKLSELEEQGMIKSFEYTYELAWNVMKDYFEFQGEQNIIGSRDAIRLSFRRGLIEDGENWMKMIESRIKTSHTYDQEIADEIANQIFHKYYELFILFKKRMDAIQSGQTNLFGNK